MQSAQNFKQYLTEKKKSKKYIDERVGFTAWFLADLKGEPPTFELIDKFIKDRWCGYVSKDKNHFQFLNDYADFCELTDPTFTNTYRAYIRETFESEARKAMKSYKDAMVFIPSDTKINPIHLNGLSNAAFVDAFKSFQEFLYTTYDAIEQSSPFDWGWPDWKELTWYGIIHNRVIMLLNALVECGRAEDNILTIEKHRLTEHAKKRGDEQLICKSPENTKLLLKGLTKTGLHIEGLNDASAPSFNVSFPNHPNIITILCAYFKERNPKTTNHIRYFSYRFMQDPAMQTHETFFLAKTDSEPQHLREIYYWLYDQAIQHGFIPTGQEKMYCCLYKKGTKEWLLTGKGSSYHEEEFLHSADHKISVKLALPKIYHTHPDKIDWLKERFPDSFNTRWGGCHHCKEKKGTMNECKHRVIVNPNNPHYRCIKGYLYFHDPTFDDVRVLLDMYRLENNIK
ncbi:MAG: hypothetical protein FWC71_02100 [Defluviitaleaceae bacterium]|nr:hypothetical protein [Defluviitaleaceae bacterium]